MRLRLYGRHTFKEGLAAGFFTFASTFNIFWFGGDSIIDKNLVEEITQVQAAVEERFDYSPKGLGEHYRVKDEITHVVHMGENIYTIAREMKKNSVWVKPKQIVEWNNLIPPHFNLKPGQTLRLYDLHWEPQIVEASWYGPGFHGKPMANTHIFNQDDMVAAHMYLPLGMIVRVTNLENGKSIEVPITDRGDFEKYQRGIDLSRKAAKILGYYNSGTTEVLVEPLHSLE